MCFITMQSERCKGRWWHYTTTRWKRKNRWHLLALLTDKEDWYTSLKVSDQAKTSYMAVKFTVYSIRTADSVCKLCKVFCRRTMHVYSLLTCQTPADTLRTDIQGNRGVLYWFPVFACIHCAHEGMARPGLTWWRVNRYISRGQIIVACDVQSFGATLRVRTTQSWRRSDPYVKQAGDRQLAALLASRVAASVLLGLVSTHTVELILIRDLRSVVWLVSTAQYIASSKYRNIYCSQMVSHPTIEPDISSSYVYRDPIVITNSFFKKYTDSHLIA